MATNNPHKLEEIRHILKSDYTVLSLADIGFNDDIEETGTTLIENAGIKSLTIYKKYGKNCFSDDTGLIVDALNGSPGVYSARYAGENATFDENVTKLLSEMNDMRNRKAAFCTVISLVLDGVEYSFEGRIDGVITKKRSGSKGFGYDPIFLPNGYDLTFAEMPAELKNAISHRAIATKKLVDFLKLHN